MDAYFPEPYRRQIERKEMLGDESAYRWIEDVLAQRVFAWSERSPETAAEVGVLISRRYSKYRAEITGLQCSAAIDFVRSQLLRWHALQVGLVGKAPEFENPDFQSKLAVGKDSITFILLEPAANRLRELTEENVGRELFMEIDGQRVVIPIRIPFGSGRLVIERDRVPRDMADVPLLPFRVNVVQCQPCEQTNG
jgi:hypothetical protein